MMFFAGRGEEVRGGEERSLLKLGKTIFSIWRNEIPTKKRGIDQCELKNSARKRETT